MKPLSVAKNTSIRESSSFTIEKKWMRTEEIANYLGITIGAVRNMFYRGHLKAYRLGRRTYGDREEIDRLIEFSGKEVQ